jgi:putative flippase GtrA
VSLLAHLHRRFATLIAELTKFGMVGTLGLIVDLGGASLLHGGLGLGPLTAKVISVSVATGMSYTGHRLWTFRHRAEQSIIRGGVIFFGLNLVGLLVSLLVIGFVTGVLGLGSLIAYNIAQVVGVMLGMLFRYWSYRRWVFLAFEPGQEPDALATTAPATAAPQQALPAIAPVTQPQDRPGRAASRAVPSRAVPSRAMPSRAMPPRPVLKPDR